MKDIIISKNAICWIYFLETGDIKKYTNVVIRSSSDISERAVALHHDSKSIFLVSHKKYELHLRNNCCYIWVEPDDITEENCDIFSYLYSLWLGLRYITSS